MRNHVLTAIEQHQPCAVDALRRLLGTTCATPLGLFTPPNGEVRIAEFQMCPGLHELSEPPRGLDERHRSCGMIIPGSLGC
jgi:hypothetical protein